MSDTHLKPKRNLSHDTQSIISVSSADIDKVSEKPVFPVNLREMVSICYVIMRSGLPTSVNAITNFLTPLICLMFVGNYGTPSELAGTSLGNTITIAVSIALYSSINQGFQIMASHLFGAKKFKEVGLLYQRNLCVLGVIVIFSILIMCFIDRFLLAIGLNHDVSINTGIYLRYLIPSVIGLNIYDCTRFYLMAQKHFFFQGVVQFSMAVVHIFWCGLFVAHLDMSVKGAAIAKSITDLSSAAILVVYVKFNKDARQCSIPWNKACLQKLGSHIKETLVMGGNTYINWMALEVSIFIVSFLNDEFIIGAHGSAFTLSNALFASSLGNSLATQAYIGNSVGEGFKHKAQKFMAAGLLVNLLYSFIGIAIMLVLNRQIAHLFTSDETTIGIFRNMLFIYCIAHIADTTSNYLAAVIRTVGREVEVLHNFVFCYVVFGLGCQLIFGLLFKYGYIGVWFSLTAAMYLMLILMTRKIFLLDWDRVVNDVKIKVDSYQEVDEHSKLLETS